jgi:hypothetical protein
LALLVVLGQEFRSGDEHRAGQAGFSELAMARANGREGRS